MKNKVLILLAITLINPGIIHARKMSDSSSGKKPLPVIVNFQYAGNVGLVSLGIGTAIRNQKIHLGLVYGYLPKSINDAEVHTLALKTSYRFHSGKISERISSSINGGANLNLGIAKNTYLSYPDYFPDKYYYTNAIHLAPFIGQRTDILLNKGIAESIGLYMEFGTLDSYLFSLLKIPHVPINSIFNLCTGISIILRDKPEKR